MSHTGGSLNSVPVQGPFTRVPNLGLGRKGGLLCVWRQPKHTQVGGCQNYGPCLGPYYNTAPIILGYPKRDHNFDNYVSGHRSITPSPNLRGLRLQGVGLQRTAPIPEPQLPIQWLVRIQAKSNGPKPYRP